MIPQDQKLPEYRQGSTLGDDKKSDAYRVFEKMLKSGNPPNSWEELLRVSQSLKAKVS